MRATAHFEFAGLDLCAEIEFHCTYKGFPGGYNDPPEAPEFELLGIDLFKRSPNKDLEALELPKWLDDALAQSDEVYAAMEKAWEDYEPGDDW